MKGFQFKRSWILNLLALLGVLVLAGCQSTPPIKIGLAVELTGRRADLGVAARDGAVLAVENINANGGVAGRQIELLIMDDQGDPQIARQVDQQLVSQGVVAIVGHLTSEQTAAAFEQMNQAGVVLFSPTSSSGDFSNQADYFFRIMPSNDLMARSLARYIYEKTGVRRLTVIYDIGNQSFTETYLQNLQAEFTALGGEFAPALAFQSGISDLRVLVQPLGQSVQADAASAELARQSGVVLIASAVDTALLSQYLRQAGSQAQLFSSTWAQTPELLEKGGAAVDGMILAATYDPNDPSATYQEFARLYQDRFQRPPSLGSSHTYETIYVLAQALAQTNGEAAGLPQALLQVRDFPGVHSSITLDANGDVVRQVYIVQVVGSATERHFQTIAFIQP